MATDLAIIGLGTALPDNQVTQHQAGRWLSDYLGYPPTTKRFAERIFRLSSVETRYSVLRDFTNPERSELYLGGLPRLEERMRVFQAEAPRLAERACNEAIRHAEIANSDVSHLIVVTSTGFFTPGPDVELVSRLGLPETVERTVVSMAGCSGAFTGLRVARSVVGNDPSAIVLMVCVELSSIHLDDEPDHDKIVAYSIFGDACAAAVISKPTDDARTVARITDIRTRLEADGREFLKWDLKSSGFSITLSDELAPFLSERIAGFVDPMVDPLLGRSGAARDISSWVVHPGGPSILRNVQVQLDLKPDALESSWNVLRNAGNLSSASVLFVLRQEHMKRNIGDTGLLLGFGPGVTLEGAVFTHGGRAFDQI